MSYVSLENSEDFLKCFEVIAEDKSCIVSDSVLYFSGKTGKGFITVAGVSTGIEVLAVNVSMLTEDLTIRFQPFANSAARVGSDGSQVSSNSASYILCFDETELPPKGDNDLPVSPVSHSAEKGYSAVSITDAAAGGYDPLNAWNTAKGIIHYLEVVHELLQSRDYVCTTA